MLSGMLENLPFAACKSMSPCLIRFLVDSQQVPKPQKIAADANLSVIQIYVALNHPQFVLAFFCIVEGLVLCLAKRLAERYHHKLQ